MHAFVLSHSAFHGHAAHRPSPTTPLRRAHPASRPPAPHNRSRSSRPSPRASQSSPDVLVVGGGAAGLSTAYHLAKDGASVRVLAPPHRDPAMLAAAGMLAPLAENTSAHMHTLCAAALAEYPPFVSDLSRDAPHIDVQFRSQNHYLVPALRGDRPPVSPHARFPPAAWLSGHALSAREPALSSLVTEAAFLPGDASVDNRRLHAALHYACVARGVRIDPLAARRVQTDATGSTVQAVVSESGELLTAGHYVVAAGAWTRTVLPGVPVHPVKGQMLSLRAPPPHSGGDGGAPGARLRHALFGKHVYIIPRDEDDLYIVGATVEPSAGFALHNTAGGVRYLLDSAMQLVPGFENYELAETWAGVRPTTPDMQPVIGMSHCDNLSVVSGFHRYGILLTPIAGRLAAAVAAGTTQQLPQEMRSFFDWFTPHRFDTGDFQHVLVVPLGASGVATAAAATAVVPSVMDEQGPVVSVNDESTSQPSPAVPKRNPVPVPQTREEAVLPVEAASKKPAMMFRVLDDGSQEPVSAPPGWKPMAAPTATRGGVGLGLDYDIIDSNFVVSSSIPRKAAKEDVASVPKQEETKEKLSTASELPTYTESVENPESVSGENDAYEDIMVKRNEVGNDERARAANRAFGRPKSSLEGDGDDEATLSLSEEESKLFDVAFEQGLKEMEEFAKSFDPNDPSVLATKRDMQAYDAFEGTQGVNGATTLNAASVAEQQFSEDGYF